MYNNAYSMLSFEQVAVMSYGCMLTAKVRQFFELVNDVILPK